MLLIDKADGVAIVTMNRPEAMNAMSKALRAALDEAFVGLRDDDDVRAIVLTGAGGKRIYHLRNSNELIGEPGILGVKTATSDVAGPCVAVCMERDPLVRLKADGTKGATPRRLMVVVLNHPDRFNRARELIHQGWAVYDPWLAAGAPVQDRQRELLSLPTPQ